MILTIAGGVGGAKMADGLQAALPPSAQTVVVNTADDFDLFGLRICPDLDTVMYTLAGISDPVNGWGIAGDTHHTLDALARLGEDPWFTLGDSDFATHIYRTSKLRSGEPLSRITAEMSKALSVPSQIIPMTDDTVGTMIETPEDVLGFQDYFVARRQRDEVVGVTFAGIDRALAHPAALAAVQDAQAIIIAPSNPIVSVQPILDTPGMREALASAPAPIVAISPIIGGEALKGPAARMLASLGHDVSALGVARIYAGLVSGFVIDFVDGDLASAIEDLGLRVLVTEAVMRNREDRQRLGEEVLAFASTLVADGSAVR